MTVKTVRLAELVEDLSIYPRRSVSQLNVGWLVAAIEKGKTLPPMVIDGRTLRIIDGFHRRRAYIKVYGEDHQMRVEVRTYETETELLVDAAALNSDHGLPLAQVERRQVVLRLKEMGADDEAISRAINIPEPLIRKVEFQVAHVVRDNGEPLRREALKGSTLWMQGRNMTEAQARAHRGAPGTQYALLIRQIRSGMEWGLIQPDARTNASLAALAREIADYLASQPDQEEEDPAPAGDS